jgi:hypothetical protein
MFAIEANVSRSIPILVRSRKARALLADLSMQPDYHASREELATLFWGDNPDIQARLRRRLRPRYGDACGRRNSPLFEKNPRLCPTQVHG